MITAVHTLIYADDADAARAFFRDVLEWPYVDGHGGWLIFKTGPSELGVHPTAPPDAGESGSIGRHHEISLMCDDIEATMAELAAKGAEFTGGITDAGYGRFAMLHVPTGGELMVYEPRHPEAYNL